MGAKVLIPMPGTDKCVLVEDLGNTDNQRVVGKDELGPYGGLLKFADSRRDAVGGVARTLNLDFSPRTFFAIFSKEFEAELARKETNFRSRRPEDIEETVFRVSVVGGRYEVVVDEQTVRRR
jgi:hypothetical protein